MKLTNSTIYRDDLLRAEKAARKYTDEQIALKTALHTRDRKPLSRPTVAKVLNGDDSIDLATLAAVAAVLELRIALVLNDAQEAAA